MPVGATNITVFDMRISTTCRRNRKLAAPPGDACPGRHRWVGMPLS